MGKTRAGGQSAQRFARLREEQKHNFFKTIAQRANQAFIENQTPVIDGIAIGGTDITVTEFVEQDLLDHRLQDCLVGTYNVEYADKQGLEDLVERAHSDLLDEEAQEMKDALEILFTSLKTNPDEIAYGKQSVRTALEYGAVDTLLVSETIATDTYHDLTEKTENQGGTVYRVPTTFEKGEQLNTAFNGIAAICRFPINYTN